MRGWRLEVEGGWCLRGLGRDFMQSFYFFYLGGRLVFVSGWNWGFGASVDTSWDERVSMLEEPP
jgi:hypothetical protein